MADKIESSGAGGPFGDDYDLSNADEHDIELLLRHGIAFQRFMTEAREIEKTYLEKPNRMAEDVRAAAVYIRRSLESAAIDAGGFELSAVPVPLKLIFDGLNDVQAGHYSRVLSPSRHKFGQSYETHDRLMTIGHALAIWDVLQKLGIKPAVARERVITALNNAGFQIPKTRTAENIQTTGEVTADAITQWRKRARRGDAPYANVYDTALANLRMLLETLPVNENKDLTADELIIYLKGYVFAHRIDEQAVHSETSTG